MDRLSRREFLKLKGFYFASLAIFPRTWPSLMADFPVAERLGRVVESKVELKSGPDIGSRTLDVLYHDAVVPWLSEVVGVHPHRVNQRWVETPDGFLYAPALQPVENSPNKPVETLPETSLGPGMWVEVTVPWVDVILANPPPRSP